MNIPDEAIAGACVVLYGELPCTDPTCYRPRARKVAAAVIEAALPVIEKEIRAKVAEEIRAEIPPVRPKNPFAYDPWEDDSVDPTNTDDVIRAAVWLGIDSGQWEATQAAARIAEGATND